MAELRKLGYRAVGDLDEANPRRAKARKSDSLYRKVPNGPAMVKWLRDWNKAGQPLAGPGAWTRKDFTAMYNAAKKAGDHGTAMQLLGFMRKQGWRKPRKGYARRRKVGTVSWDNQ